MTTFPLGRLVRHDPRSLSFPAPVSAKHKPVFHLHHGPVFDQGQVGSCTGNAMAQCLMTAPHYRADRTLTEADAVSIYSAATAIDDSTGTYPPDDTGSSGLAVATVAKTRGLISAYSHAFGVDHAIGALQLSPFIFGTSWHQSMFKPDKNGFVHPDGAVVGGHEILCLGDTGKHLTFLNSWGGSWGKAGAFFLSYADFAALIADSGDVVVPAP